MTTLSVIGRDQSLTRRVAKRVLDALRYQYDYTSLRTTKRGYTFTVEEADGRVMRVTVEMEPWSDSRTPAGCPPPESSR